MAKIDAALNWMYQRKGKVTYSMISRWGPSSYDCSSAVYFALKYAGMLPANTAIGNTDSLFGSLERAGWTQVRAEASGNIPARRGDVFIWGVRGASSGASGHTGFFCDDSDNIIHCNSGHNGITVNPHDAIWEINGCPPVTIYRPPAEGPSADEVYRDTRRAVDDVLNTQFVRQGDLARKKFGNDRNATYRGVIEFSDENFQQVQKRLDDVDRTLHSTQAEQTSSLRQIEQKVNGTWDGIFVTSTAGGEKHPGILPLLEKIAHEEGVV